MNNGIGIHVSGKKADCISIRRNSISCEESSHDLTKAGREGIRISQASAVVSGNSIRGCTNGIFMMDGGDVAIEKNSIAHSNGAAVLVRTPWRNVIVKENSLKDNGWGVLCRSVQCTDMRTHSSAVVKQHRQRGTLSVIENRMERSGIAAVVVSGGGLGGCLLLAVERNHLIANRAGIVVSGPALRLLVSESSKQCPYNAIVKGNTIERSDTAAVSIERGAAAYICDNRITHNGRGVSVHDYAASTCCARVENNIFDENNGWALRFCFMAYTGRSLEAKETELRALLERTPPSEHKPLLLARLLPKIIAINKCPSKAGRLKVFANIVKRMTTEEIARLVVDDSCLDHLLQRHELCSSAPRVMSARDSLVWNNVFVKSDRTYGRGAWAWRSDTTAQAPHAVGNVDQSGAEVLPHLPRPEVVLSHSQPAWCC